MLKVQLAKHRVVRIQLMHSKTRGVNLAGDLYKGTQAWTQLALQAYDNMARFASYLNLLPKSSSKTSLPADKEAYIKLDIADELYRSLQSIKETSEDLFNTIREGVREAQKDYRLRVAYEKGKITIADLEKMLDNKEINLEDIYQLAATTSKDRKALIDLLARKTWEELCAIARAAGVVISFVPGIGDLYEIFEAISKYSGSRELTLAESLVVIGTILLPGAAGGILKNVGKAVEEALKGSKHAGLLKNYANKFPTELRKAIRSYEKQIALHQEKIKNPEKYCEDWNKIDLEAQLRRIEKWKKDMVRLQEQKEIMEYLLRAKGATEIK